MRVVQNPIIIADRLSQGTPPRRTVLVVVSTHLPLWKAEGPILTLQALLPKVFRRPGHVTHVQPIRHSLRKEGPARDQDPPAGPLL